MSVVGEIDPTAPGAAVQRSQAVPLAGTKLTFAAEGEPGGFFRVAAPLLRKSIKDTMKGDLASLKTKLEARA